MERSIDVLREMVAGRSVAVVGNAPTAAQFPHAERIDAADVVVRFNRFGLEFPNVGRKTDVVAVPLGYGPAYPSPAMLAKTQPRLILGAPPKLNSVGREIWRLEGRDHAIVPPAFTAALGRELGCRPTTGLITLCYLLDACAPAAVYLTGFSFQNLP